MSAKREEGRCPACEGQGGWRTDTYRPARVEARDANGHAIPASVLVASSGDEIMVCPLCRGLGVVVLMVG